MRTQERARCSEHRNTRCQDRTEAAERPRLADWVTRGLAAKAPSAPSLAKGFLFGDARTFPGFPPGNGTQRQHRAILSGDSERHDSIVSRNAQCQSRSLLLAAAPNLAAVSLCYKARCSSQDRDWRCDFEGAPRRCRARRGVAFSSAPAEARRRGAAAVERATSREPTAALRFTSRPFPRAQTTPFPPSLPGLPLEVLDVDEHGCRQHQRPLVGAQIRRLKQNPKPVGVGERFAQQARPLLLDSRDLRVVA
jgi:hypothetical protein